MVGTIIDAHVMAAGHVAGFALGAAAHREKHLSRCGSNRLADLVPGFVEMMPLLIVHGCPVALQAEVVAFFDAPNAVHVVAVAAANIAVVHFTPHE